VSRRGNSGYWQEMSQTPRWKSWAGYAFESVCFKHIEQIRHALDVPASAGVDSWQYLPKSRAEDGVQIDLLFDRNDNAITVCEIKYCSSPYTLGKQEAAELRRKVERFKRGTSTAKQIIIALVTSSPLRESMYSEELVEARATLDDLMGR
jgi:uncharacterized protein